AVLDRNRADAAVDTDAVLEVQHIVSDGETAGCGTRSGLAIASGATNTAGAPEDLVVGKRPQRRHGEATVQCSDNQHRFTRQAAMFIEKFVEPLTLSIVVTEDDGWQTLAQQPAQRLQITIDFLGREKSHLESGRFFPNHQAREYREPGLPFVGCDEQFFPWRSGLSQSAC